MDEHMGIRGNRKGNAVYGQSPISKYRIRNNNKHRELCLIGANWLKHLQCGGIKYITIELVTQGWELADVWGTTGFRSYLIEAKTSRSDFQKDAKKEVREKPEEGMGNFRYYLCPEGLIYPEEIPDKWGLLYERDGTITIIREAEEQEANNRAENAILCSVMRREGIKAQVFNYRKQKQ